MPPVSEHRLLCCARGNDCQIHGEHPIISYHSSENLVTPLLLHVSRIAHTIQFVFSNPNQLNEMNHSDVTVKVS